MSELQTLAALAVDAAVTLGVTTWVIAPGSRSAPLTVALAARTDVTRYVVYDERSAGYIALGIAQQLQRPVGLICTSGTAAANLGPAVIEAFYQRIPLLVLTADRPPEWIDQEDNQAIRQNGLYGAHVKASFTLLPDDGHPDTRWHARRTIADAVGISALLPWGPVHVNVPLREPLYAAASVPIGAQAPVAVTLDAHRALDPSGWERVLAGWRSAHRILIIGGLHPADASLAASLSELVRDSRVALIGDVTSNIHAVAAAVHRWESILSGADQATLDTMAPDLAITFGGPVTARALKSLLRTRPPEAFWRVSPVAPPPDTFQALTLAIPLDAAGFFRELAARCTPRSGFDYANVWADRARRADIGAFLGQQPFGEFVAMHSVLRMLPASSALQIGNSMPIRYANLIGIGPERRPAQVNANRGTSGIDGTVSTAVGAALARPDGLTTLLIGDLGFFYDRNGLWHSHLPANLRIVLLNNHGGGIFDLIDGPAALAPEVRRDYFLTPQPLRAERTAADFGMDYARVRDLPTLEASLATFWQERGRPALLEIESDMATNGQVFASFREWARTL